VGWRSLRHPSVIPLLGVTTIGDRLVMVTEWMVNGNINGFLKMNPDADRLELVCLFCSRSFPSLSIDDRVFAAVERRYQGIDLYA